MWLQFLVLQNVYIYISVLRINNNIRVEKYLFNKKRTRFHDCLFVGIIWAGVINVIKIVGKNKYKGFFFLKHILFSNIIKKWQIIIINLKRHFFKFKIAIFQLKKFFF